MIMQYSSFFAATDQISSSSEQQVDNEESRNDSNEDVILNSLSASLRARFGWLGFSPPNSEGWRIPLLEVSPFDVPLSKREHWMKVWRNWKESGKQEAFAFSLVYVYGRNKLALFPTADITPYVEAKKLGFHLPPHSIRRKLRYHERFTTKEQKLMKGLDEFSQDVVLTYRRRIAKRVGGLECKENQPPAPTPKAIPSSDDARGRTLQDSSNQQFSHVVTPPSLEPFNDLMMAPSRGLDDGAIELLRQSNPFRPATTIPHPPGFERRDSSLLFQLTDTIDVDARDLLERAVVNAAHQAWNVRTPYPIPLENVAIQCNFTSTLGVSMAKFAKLVNDWILHKEQLEKFHNQWFKAHISSDYQYVSKNPWASSSPSKVLVGFSNFT
jgi:hypothetical protein